MTSNKQTVVIGRTFGGNTGFFTGNYMTIGITEEEYKLCLNDPARAKDLAHRLGFGYDMEKHEQYAKVYWQGEINACHIEINHLIHQYHNGLVTLFEMCSKMQEIGTRHSAVFNTETELICPNTGLKFGGKGGN